MKVELQTRDGEKVVAGFIPQLIRSPDVIYWGTRTFTFHQQCVGGLVRYREAFAVPLINISSD